MPYLLNNETLLLIILGALIATFVITFPATVGSKEFISRLKIAIVLVLGLGLILGILKSAAFLVPNKYLQYGLYYLALSSFVSTIDKYVLIPSLAAASFLLVFYVTRTILGFIGVSKRLGDAFSYGIGPSLLIFAIVGYWINRLYLPEFLDVKSIMANVIWTLGCAFLAWGLGILIVRISQTKINFPDKLYTVRVLAGLVGLVLVLNFAYFIYSQSFKSDRPNLILISIDTLRADHLGCYGYHRNTSPNIDAFAKEGVLFANTIAQSSWTLPSHMAMLTSLYPTGHGVLSKDRKLVEHHLTIAEILQNAGYETAAITDKAYLSRKYGYQGFDFYHDQGCLSCRGAVEKTYTRAINWLENNHSRPFFLFLHTYQVHAPYDPFPDYDIYSDKNYEGIIAAFGHNEVSYHTIQDQMKTEDFIYLLDRYDGEIVYTDHFIGKLFEDLRELGLYDSSIIVLTSDHGENFLDHRAHTIGHTELYDEIVKVPLIIKAPTLPKNKTIEAQVESIDIMPTVLELLGISVPVKVDGQSLVGLINGGAYDTVFAFSEKNYEYKMIRSKDWKLLRKSEDKLELYDLINDPEEQLNILEQKKEITRSLFEALNIWADAQKRQSELNTADNKIELDDELTEQLKALGYIN